MRFSEAERYAFRTVCFNRPDEARLIMQARRQIGPLSNTPSSSKPAEQAPKPAPAPEKTTWKPLGSSSRRGRDRGWSTGRRFCGY